MAKTEYTRMQNATQNVAISMSAQVVITILSFVNRSIFIKILGDGYLGVDGLFTSILSMMSIAELGIGNAIIFNLYKPVANKDYQKIRELMHLYAKTYRIIAFIIATIGVILIPFLGNFVNFQSVTIDINLQIVYLLFLLNTCSSYFWAYKQSMIIVNQRQRVISTIQMICKLSVVILELIVLLLLHNYYIYLIIRVLFNYIQAFVIGKLSNRDYPEAKFTKKDILPRQEKSTIFNNVRALMWYKVSNVFITSTDNIMINAFVGTETVGVFSNYTLITTAVQNVTSQIFSALTASIGNFNATETRDKQEDLFKKCVFITFLVYGFCSLCLCSLSNRFICLIWGERYILDYSVVAIIVLNFYLYGFQSSILVFRNTNGLFVQGKYRPALSAFINVVASYLLVNYMGIIGVVLGTAISRITTTTWFDPFVLYKYQFKKSVFTYYVAFVKYTIVTVVACCLCNIGSSYIPNSFAGFFITGVLCLIVFGVLTLLCFGRTNEFKYVLRLIIKISRRFVKR